LAIARVRVDAKGSAPPAVYQLPIALRHAPKLPPSTVIATFEDGALLYDALYDDAFLTLLAHGVTDGLVIGDALHERWVVDPARVIPSGARDLQFKHVRIGSAEQSNSSIIIDDSVIVKLFRRLVPGVHPEVEIARALTRAKYAATPTFLGEFRFEDDHGTTIAGMAQRYVPGAVDLWSYALERGESYFTSDHETTNEFVEDARRLGRATRAMHVALARATDDPAFAPEPVSRDDVDRWAHRVQQSVRESLALLGAQLDTPGFPRDRAAEARVLASRRDHFVGWINEIVDSLGDDLGQRTRIHGDFHLGQVLRAPDGKLLIIDFEGEPTKSLDERREKTSPLRDVAGMLRSFAYAAATLAMRHGARVQPHVRELRAARWERDVRAAFLDGYLASSDEHDALPPNVDDTRRLIDLFEADKAFYELSYELNNRPTWAWIPMRGISKLLVQRSS
jgi:maltose alpha-D-glucosyltransferase/alpha-amylase